MKSSLAACQNRRPLDIIGISGGRQRPKAPKRPGSSVVEHILGKDEVGSSILLWGSRETSFPTEGGLFV